MVFSQILIQSSKEVLYGYIPIFTRIFNYLMDSYNIYGNELEKAAQRKRTMEAMQQDINHRIFDSPINHHRM